MVRKEAIKAILLETGNDFINGEPVMIHTMTYHYTGRVVGQTKTFVVLEDAAWIPEDGRFMQCIENGAVEEVEPVTGPVRINLEHITAVYHWGNPLPRSQK